MSSTQCSVCKATVDAAKAYCPECGAAMDEEEKRTSFSEFDQLMKTQNINSTTHFRLMEQFKLSTVFKPPQASGSEKNKETAAKPAQADKPPPEKISNPKPPENLTNSPSRTVGGQIENRVSDDKTQNSDTKKYIVIGVISFLLALLVVSVILSLLIWIYLR